MCVRECVKKKTQGGGKMNNIIIPGMYSAGNKDQKVYGFFTETALLQSYGLPVKCFHVPSSTPHSIHSGT